MSFIGRAAVWTNASDTTINPRLTPLNVMTGSRIAATRDGVAGWTPGPSWNQLEDERTAPSALTEHLRRPYQHLFEAISRRANRAADPRVCPRCGQAPHTDWGYEYERLVCMETTAA
jgi:hypothetical protein